jgi:hypothetical protein
MCNILSRQRLSKHISKVTQSTLELQLLESLDMRSVNLTA